MAGILFLRDIDVDILMRCRSCGHEGLLTRGDLERRFGPSYPVLSIAPHYRCSRCHSKDVESSPGPLAAPPADLHATRDEDTVDAGIAALQGLLDAVRGDRPAAVEDAIEEAEDDVVDLMPHLREAEAKAEIDADDDLFERTMASLRTVAHPERNDDGEEALAQAAPEPEAEAEIDAAENVGDDEDEDEGEDDDAPFDRSLAALRDLIGDEPHTDEEPYEDAPAEPFPERAPGDARAAVAEIVEGEHEEEGEPFFRPRESAPPSASEMELSLAALRALVEKAAQDTPPPAPEPEAEEPEPHAPAEPEPAAHGDDEPFDETIAALRSLIADRHRDADEDADEPPPDDEEEPVEDEPESLDDISESEILSFTIRDPELAPDEEAGETEHGPSPDPAPPKEPPARTSHLNETLAKLRGMLELDRPHRDADGEPPPHRPRRR
ncbi:MAG TPA: hypothetical protein VD995_11740 [Azospirillum sp.]|nr:hypothetical protein [Azospirillum sp.]